MKLWVMTAFALASFAQTPAPQPAKSVVGEVTVIDVATQQLTVKSDAGTSYSVKLQDSTAFMRMLPGETDIKKATRIAFADISLGDRIIARGNVSEENKTVPARTIIVMTKTDLAKKHEQDRDAWQKGIVGVVSAVSPDAKEITVTQRGAGAKSMVIDSSKSPGFLRYAPGSNRFDEAKPGTFADIKPGDNLRARGTKNEDGTRLTADQVLSGSFVTLAATVISVDTVNGIVKVNDLQTKKPVEIKTTPDTMVRRIPEMMATMMARRMNPAAAGAPGIPGPGPAVGGPPAGGRPGGMEGAPRPGGPGMGGRGGAFDLHDALERMPAMPLTELKPGEPVIISSTKGTSLTAITLVAGVEPFLASAPRTGGQVNLGSWSFDGGVPVQ